MPDEQFAELLNHHNAVHHGNRAVKRQTYGKRWREPKHGAPRCPACHQHSSHCLCETHRLGR